MTSTNDGKEVKSNQTSGPKGKTYYIELYKSLEAGLSGDCELRERTQHLCEAWRRIYSLCQHSASTTHPHLLSWLQRHTARTVLQTEWQSPKSNDDHKSLEEAINAFVKECENRSGTSREAGPPPWETQLLARGEWFKRILANPWGHPVLRVLLDPRGEPPSEQEVLEWLKEERGVMFVTRLRQLAASKCDDLALSLSSAVMDRVRACVEPPSDTDVEQNADIKAKPQSEKKPTFEDILKTEAGFTVDVWELLIDMEFVLLYKRDKRSRCIELAKQTPLRSGYQLVERLQSRLETSPREKKLWKNAKEVATLIAQVVITRCMVVPVCSGTSRTALYCCARSLVRVLGPRLPAAARALAAPAATARHLHTLAAAVDAQSTKDLKPFVCELYVRAITAGMNELERLKLKTEKEEEARSAEQTLSSWFTQLGALLSASERIRCECTLTAFSMHPTPAMYERIKAAPVLPPLALDVHETKEEPKSDFGSWANDSRSQTNFVKTSETLNLKHTQHQANVLSTAIFSEGETLGISPELCQDIAVLLSGPRLKTLSWDTDREALLEKCQAYMERTNFGTRSVTTELKYLNLDPRQYQHLPEEEEDDTDMYYGIEKGYEHHLAEYQEPEEIWQDADDPERTESASSSDIDQEIVRKTKKKNKKILSSEDDSDPLSLVAEAKRVEKKKERPHSKERSKELKRSKSKSKPKDPLEINDPTSEKKKEPKKKEKRERKRKEKPVPTEGNRSLSNLIGMKVTNVRPKRPDLGLKTPSVSDSDYDSQGKCSVVSEGNETDVLFDGLFSMDELKSPERSPDKIGLMRNIEHHVSTGAAAVSTPSVINSIDTQSRNNAPVYRVPNVSKSRTSSPSNQTHPLVQGKMTTINEDVKKSISKLIQFRRQRTQSESEQILQLQPNVVHKYSYQPGSDSPTITPQTPVPPVSQISPKAIDVKTSHSPKVYMNKTQSEQLAELKNEVNNLLCSKTFGIARPVIQYSPKTNNSLHNNSLTDGIRPPNPNSQRLMQDTYRMPQIKPNQTVVSNESKVTPSRPSASRRTPIESPNRQNFHVFLKELQESINAGAGGDTRIKTGKKEIKPISRVIPVQPAIKTEPKSYPQCAKQHQKKSENLNTFSRLSYLHKNKMDVKSKELVNALIEFQSKKLQNHPPLDVELNKMIQDQKNLKSKHLQSRSNSSAARADTSAHNSQDNTQSLLRKIEKPKYLNSARENPIMANILTSATVKTEDPHKNVKVERGRDVSMVSNKFSSLTERDHEDLLILLRQQSKMNQPQTNVDFKEKPRPPHTITSSMLCTSQSSTKIKTTGPSSAVHSNNRHNIGTSPNIKPSNSNDERMPNNAIQTNATQSNATQSNATHTKALNMIKTELNCSKAVDPKSKKIQILNDILIKSNKQKSVCATKTSTEKDGTDWQKVMDAIRSHKTPSRGPNALDMALNKDSYNTALSENLQNQRIIRTNSTGDPIMISNEPTKRQTTLAVNASPTQSRTTPTILNRSKSESVIKTNKNKSTTKQEVVQRPQTNKATVLHANTNLSRPIQPETPRLQIQTEKRTNHALKDQVDVLKKIPNKHQEKQFTCPYYKEEDPFISGIPNSDYDLLEELMDDDLRQEIGELSSDEDSYRAPMQSLKDDKNYIISKPITPMIKKEEKGLQPSVINTTSVYKKPVQKLKCDITKTAFEPAIQGPSGIANMKTVIKSAEDNSIDAASVHQTKVVQPAKVVQPTKVVQPAEVVQPIQVHQPAKVIQPTNVVQPTHAVHRLPQTVIAPHRNSNGHSFNNANLLRTVGQTNSFVPAGPQQTALKNVVVIGSDIVYQPCTETMIRAAPVAQKTYLAFNNQPNMSIYQTTQFAAPDLNPLIIGNAVTVPVSKTPLNESTTAITKRSEMDNHTLKNQEELKNKVIQNRTINLDCNDIKADPKSSLLKTKNPDQKKFYINSNKNCERKVLSEVHEKQKNALGEKIDPKPAKSLPRNSFDRDTKNEALKDQERLKNKRLAILNRTICHRSDNEAIPLTYAPLTIVKVDLNLVKDNKTNENFITTSNSKSSKLESLVNIKVRPAENSVETKENKDSCRRILLRSCNKVIEVNSEVVKKIAIPKKTEVRLKPTPIESASNGTDEDLNRELKINKKRILGKKVNKRIKKLNTNKKGIKSLSKRNVQKTETTLGKETEPNPAKAETCKQMSDFLDLEDEIVNSVILKTVPLDQSSMPARKFDQIQENDSDNHIMKEFNGDYRSSQNILDKDVSENPVLQNESLEYTKTDASVIPQDIKMNRGDINIKDDTNAKISENQNELNKQNMKNTTVVKEIESYIKRLENMKPHKIGTAVNELYIFNSKDSKEAHQKFLLQPNRQTTKVPVKSITRSTTEVNKITAKNLDKTEDKRNDQGSTTEVKKSVANNLDKTDTDELEVICLDGDDNDKQSINKNKEMRKELSIKNKVLNKVTGKSNEENKKLKINDKIPQSLMDAITIEDLPHLNTGDPLQKCVRIKLPSGRVFKATVHGQMNVDTNTLFADPALKSVLLSNVSRNKRYTLNIKQLSTTSKSQPDKIIESHIQEIQLASNTFNRRAVEIIDLLSDSDEESDNFNFNTEYGKFKVGTMKRKLHEVYQRSFDKKCVVKLKRISQHGGEFKENFQTYLTISPKEDTNQETETLASNVSGTDIPSIEPLRPEEKEKDATLEIVVPTDVQTVDSVGQPDNQSVVPPDVHPIYQPVVEPSTLLTKQSIIQPDIPVISVVEPSDQSVMQPSVQSVDEPSVQAVVQPAIQCIVQSNVQSVLQPIHQPVIQPVLQPSDQPVMEPIVQSVIQPDIQHVVQPVVQPVRKSIVRLDTRDVQQVNQPSNQPSTVSEMNKPKSTQNEPEIIEIDDSSNDETDLIIPDLTKNITTVHIPLAEQLSDSVTVQEKFTAVVPVENIESVEAQEKINEFRNLLFRDLGIEDIGDKSSQSEGMTASVSLTNDIDPAVSKDTSTQIPTPSNCFVKLSKCDDLLRRYKTLKLLKECFVRLVRCDESYQREKQTPTAEMNGENTNDDEIIDIHETSFDTATDVQPLSRCGSFSILTDYEILENLQTVGEITRSSSPVMEAYETIALLIGKNAFQKEYCETLTCEADWFLTKSKFHWLYKDIAIQDHEDDRYKAKVQDKHNFDSHATLSPSLESSLILPSYLHMAPLKTLVLKFFQNNPFIDHLKSPRLETKCTMDGIKPNLKRKSRNAVRMTNKISKMCENLLLEPRTDAFDRKDLATHEEVVKDSELICNTENDLEIVQECNDVNEKAMDVSEVYLEPQSFEKVISAMEGISTVESTSTEENILSVASIPIIGSILTEESIRTVKSIPTEESNPTEESIPNMESIPLESTLILDSITTVDSIPTIESIVDSISTVESIPIVESTSIVESIASVTTIPTIESISTVDSQNDDVHTKVNTNTDEQLEHDRASSSANSLIELASFSTSVGDDSEDVSVSILHDPHPDSTQTEFYNEKPQFEVDADAILNVTEAIIETIYDNTNTIPEIENVCKETDNVTVVVDLDKENTCRQDCLTPTADKLDVENMSEDDDIITVVTDLDVNSMFCKKQIEFICNDDVNNTTSVNEPDLENKAENDCKTICKDTQNEETEPALEKNSADDCENISEYCEIITVVTDLDVNSMFCENSCEERDTPSGVEFVKENISVTIDKDCFIQPEETDNIAEMSDMNIDLNNSKEKHDDTRNDANTQHENEEFGNTVPEIDEVVQENTEKLSGADKIPVDTEMVIEDTFKQINENIDQHIEIPDMTDFDIEVICEEVSEEIVKDAVKMSTEENMVLETYCAEQIEHMSNDSNKILEGTDIYKEVIDKINDDEIRNICEDSFPVFKTFEVNTVKITKEIIDINTNSEIQKATIEVLNTDDAVILDSENNPSEESGIEINHVHRVLTVCTNTNHELIDTGDDNILNTDNVTLDREDIDSEGSDIQVNDMDRVTTNKSTNSDNLEGITETQYENKEISNISDTSDDHINNKTIILDNENTPITHDLVVNKVVLNQENYSPAVCNNEEESTKDFIKSNKNSLPEVNKINDHFLVDENCDSVEVIVDVCSDDLDQELARTVFTNVTSPVEGAPTQEPVLPVNTEAAQIESQSVELIQKENTTSETFDNIDLHSSVVECIECEDENMESNPIIEETCEDEGDVKPEETEQQAEEISEIEEIDLKLNIPKITYAKYSPKGSGASYLIIDKKNRKNLKRKAEMADFQFSCGKKYRKGKNIDYPKITPANMSGSAYSKEYKRLLDYCSSVKFSYSRPFHKECIDVHDTLTAWPIKGTCNVQESETEKDQTLFGNTETVLNNINDPSKQTLAEEIVAEYNELDYSSSDVIETNFKMGFGEGSGRVIQNLEDGCGTKFSAATLSDVKHTQPVLQSENYDNCKRVLNQNPTNDYEIEKLQRNIKCIQMKNKVRSFFKQTMAELSYDCIKQQEKEDVTHSKNLFHLNYECGLYGQDYIQPPPFEAIVQVVQVGQLPVSAAAQNPVTCDPRVTQVSNASPSQCSVENSPGDDSQSVIKTEYTELTTADLSMPLPHEYVQHIQSMPISTHEGMNYPMTSEPYNIDVDIKPEIKIEMEETPEIKEEINDNYENNEYPPLFEKNIMNNVDYSYETNPTRMAPEVNSNMGIIYNYAEKQSVTETFPHIKPQEQEQLQLHEEIQQQQQQQQQLRQQLQHQEQKQQDQHQQQQQLQQEQEEYQQLQKQLEQEQLRQQQQYQQQQIQLQQQQLEQEQRKLQEMREQQLKQQQLQEQQQQQLKELKLKQQKQQQQELKLQQQRQRELKQQQQRELKQQQQRELKQQQQQKQLELKQQQQKQQELKQQQQQQQQQERKQRQLQQQQLKQQKRQQQELQQQQKKQLLEQKKQQLEQQKKQQLEQQKKQQLEQQKKQQLEQQKKQQLEQQKKQQLEQQKKQQLEQQKQKQLEQQHQQKQQQQQMQLQQQQQQLQQQQQQNVSQDKSDQIAHAMNAAGISAAADSLTNNRAQALVNMLSQKLRQNTAGTGQTAPNYQKTTAINAMALQQALAQILPPPLNQTNATENNQQTSNAQVTPQVLHIVQGKSASGNHQQITLVDNSQQAVINTPNATPVLHIVQNKTAPPGPTSNGTPAPQTNSFSGLSLVDAGLQQGNQLLHIVNTGGQKNTNTGQLLKRVNLLTNLTNVQGGSEQKMVQFVCKSADGKPLQLNGPHQRSMVLRLQPVDTPNLQPTQPKQMESQDLSPTHSAVDNINSKDADIKSRSIYEENYAKFIQGSSPKSTVPEKGTSLPKFNQAFGKQGYQDGSQKDEISNSNSHLSPNGEHTDCQPNDNAINLEHISHIGSPPLLMRKPSISQAQTNLVQQLKQTISPMNIHGGVIYTRQIPVNIGGGQTINLITVPNTDLIDDSNQTKQQGEIEPSIIKIVPQTQTSSNSDTSDENNSHIGSGNENSHTPQPQPVLTQMRIKLPMLSKAPQMVSGGRVVRPSFFQIQRNVIGGANQPVYQQLVLTAAPPLGQQTIRPQTQTSRPVKTPSESQSSTESMSSSTLEQLREFDLVLEQVKERSTVQPNATSKTTFPSKKHTPSTDTTNAPASTSSAPAERSHLQPAPHKHHQVLYSIGNTQPLNVAYVNKKASARTPATSTTSSFVRSPDSSGIVDSSPTSSTQAQIPHTVTSEPTPSTSDAPPQAKPPKPSSKSKSRPKASSNLPNTLKLNTVPPKTSSQKPAEDEQTTQRILYILAEYKEQVENSPDKDKPAPRRRTNLPSNSGSSKRRKSYRRGRDISPIDDSCRTMGSEDSSCGTSQGDCNESCMDSHSPQDSPRKVSRKLTFEQETPVARPRPQPARNVIVADGQRIAVARSTTSGKPSTTVLMPTNYILPVSMIKGGQQIAIVTNRGPKLLTVAGGEGGATNALLLQRLIGPAGLKPVLTRPGVRHIRLPTAALHNLQAFNLTTSTVQPPDSTASPAPAPTPPDLIDTRANSSPWRDRDGQEVKPERGSSSPEGSEPWHLPASANPHDYSYEEVVRTDNMDRTVLVVQRKDGSNHRQHRLTHVSAAALRHKYAILEHELRLQAFLSQKSLSEECEDLGVDSPSASDLFPEAELLFATSPAHEHTQDHGHHSHTPQPLLHHSSIPQPDIDDQIATDQLLPRPDMHDDRSDLGMGLEDVGIVTVSEDGMQATIALDQEEFARSHPNTTFHSEPTDEGEVQPFTISGLKGRHITSTIFHANRAPGTVLMTAPQATVISQATAESSGVQNPVKYSDIDNMINSLPGHHNHTNNMNMSSVLVKDDGLTRFDGILHDNRELHLSHTASAIVHPTGSNTTQVIRRVCYGNKREQASRYLMHESGGLMASEEAKIMTEDSRDFGDADDDRSSPERAELFWESNSASERESRRHLDFSSDSDKCCKSPSFEENNSTDSSGVGAHMRLDSVIKEARRASADGSSADDTHPPPLRTYPPKRPQHAQHAQNAQHAQHVQHAQHIQHSQVPQHGQHGQHGQVAGGVGAVGTGGVGGAARSLSGKTRAGERSHSPLAHSPLAHSPLAHSGRRRASGRGVVKRGCHCCNGSPAPPRPKKPRQRTQH